MHARERGPDPYGLGDDTPRAASPALDAQVDGLIGKIAVAHYQATGKRTLLDVAIRTADLLVGTFGRAGSRSARATRSTRWGWRSCAASRATSATRYSTS